MHTCIYMCVHHMIYACTHICAYIDGEGAQVQPTHAYIYLCVCKLHMDTVYLYVCALHVYIYRWGGCKGATCTCIHLSVCVQATHANIICMCASCTCIHFICMFVHCMYIYRWDGRRGATCTCIQLSTCVCIIWYMHVHIFVHM